MTERAHRIATLYREGKGQREISRIIGISQPAVHKALRKLGVITPEHPRGDNPEESPAPLPAADNPCPEPSPAGGGDNSPRWPWRQEEVCKNCRNAIPGARLGQLYCCNACAAFHNGSRLVQVNQHSDWCPIAGQPWQQAGLDPR